MENNGYIQIKDMRAGLKNLNVVFIVLEISHPTLTKDNREVRTLKVADSSACINASIWDEAGSLLAPGDIVRLTKGYVSVWRNCLTLYLMKTGELQKIGEFCMVFNEHVNMSEPNQLLVTQGTQANNAPLNNGTNNGAGRIGSNAPAANVHNNTGSSSGGGSGGGGSNTGTKGGNNGRGFNSSNDNRQTDRSESKSSSSSSTSSSSKPNHRGRGGHNRNASRDRR